MSAEINFLDLVESTDECIMMPCVYDCGSALAAQLSGAKAILLSGGELGESMGVLEPMLTTDEVVHATSRICRFSPLPCLVDVGAGYDTPLNAYFTTERMVSAGAKGILLGNEHGTGWTEYEPILKATLRAVKGTDCIVVARWNGMLETPQEMDECVDMLNSSMDEGAHATMACGLCRSTRSKELSQVVAKRVKGWKIYPDQNSINGIPDVNNEEIFPLGYKMISYHYMMKVALDAMWRFGLENMKNKNNVASNEASFPNGIKGHSALKIFPMQQLFDLESEFTGVKREFKVPGTTAGRENG